MFRQAIAFVLIPAAVRAQAARIGRFDLLAPIPASRVGCMQARTNAELQAQGMIRMHALTDSVRGRVLTVFVDSLRRPRHFDSMMGETKGKRRESEALSATIRATGRVEGGERHAFTSGTPSRLSEDRRARLFATDSQKIRNLAAAVVRRCAAPGGDQPVRSLKSREE